MDYELKIVEKRTLSLPVLLQENGSLASSGSRVRVDDPESAVHGHCAGAASNFLFCFQSRDKTGRASSWRIDPSDETTRLVHSQAKF